MNYSAIKLDEYNYQIRLTDEIIIDKFRNGNKLKYYLPLSEERDVEKDYDSLLEILADLFQISHLCPIYQEEIWFIRYIYCYIGKNIYTKLDLIRDDVFIELTDCAVEEQILEDIIVDFVRRIYNIHS